MSQIDLIRERRALRTALRARRQRLTESTRRETADAISREIARAGWLRAGKRVGVYLATAEEISCAALMTLAMERHCRLFLPKIIDHRQHRMCFTPMGAHYRRNRYGILEPAGSQRVRTRELQLIFVPLVGFDARGQRMGMGGGYYDRALSWRLSGTIATPRIIGIAHSSQRVEVLPASTTDVPLDAVVTELGIETFRLCAP
ncbi:MAG: 5-formyltetrahydrofolate cyclo-ligase [Steroidobacteraceae bacterium]|jgi:5-formyltetrahydrofolate cyclo-ligase|nr:5-formyltetrahydrofolate cyclo-ligase [Gammaproteobacteria bacterium]